MPPICGAEGERGMDWKHGPKEEGAKRGKAPTFQRTRRGMNHSKGRGKIRGGMREIGGTAEGGGNGLRGPGN